MAVLAALSMTIGAWPGMNVCSEAHANADAAGIHTGADSVYRGEADVFPLAAQEHIRGYGDVHA